MEMNSQPSRALIQAQDPIPTNDARKAFIQLTTPYDLATVRVVDSHDGFPRFGHSREGDCDLVVIEHGVEDQDPTDIAKEGFQIRRMDRCCSFIVSQSGAETLLSLLLSLVTHQDSNQLLQERTHVDPYLFLPSSLLFRLPALLQTPPEPILLQLVERTKALQQAGRVLRQISHVGKVALA